MLDSDTFPVLIGLVILVAILVPNILLFITYRKYKRISKALPTPTAIGQTRPDTLEEKQHTLKSILLEEWAKLPDREHGVVRQALWTAMLLEAASDGNIDHREMIFIADLFGRISGEEMDFRPVIKAAELVESDKKLALSDVAKARKASNAAKEQILSAAFLVSVSDHALSEREIDCLSHIADALAINQRDQKAMLKSINTRFGV